MTEPEVAHDNTYTTESPRVTKHVMERKGGGIIIVGEETRTKNKNKSDVCTVRQEKWSGRTVLKEKYKRRHG